MIVRKSISHWVRCFAVVLLIGLLLPASPALAQDGDPGKKPRIIPKLENPQALTATIVSGANLIQDPSFESSFASSAYWKESSTNSFVICSTAGCGTHSTAKPRTGSNWVWFGGIDFTEPGDVSPEVGDVYQNVTFPPDTCKATLEFYFWIGDTHAGSDSGDNFRLLVDGRALFTANATQKNSYTSYKLVSVDVSDYANGGVHKVQFNSRISNQLVSFNLDDVSLVANNCRRAVKGDYNGDRKKDIAVFRPSTSTWFIYGDGTFIYGIATDIPVPADYNGDGKTDIAVFRPTTSTWHIYGMGDFVYGTVGDIPVVGDYNGDGKADIAVFRPTTSTWHIYGIGDFVYGTVGDVPVVGDYNGDGKDDIAVFRPSNSTWYLYGDGTYVYGTVGDIPVVADYNGDGKTDIAVFRPSASTWYIYGIGDFLYGTVGDVPVVGDYNGDGKAEIAVFRDTASTWYIYGTGDFLYGTVGDTPV